MWAKMLIEVLKDNNIPCTSLPVHGAALSIKTGMRERLKIYVPYKNLGKATELLNELFSPEDVQQNE